MPADTPITATSDQIARFAKRGTTVIEADVPDYELPPLPRE